MICETKKNWFNGQIVKHGFLTVKVLRFKYEFHGVKVYKVQPLYINSVNKPKPNILLFNHRQNNMNYRHN